MDLHFSPLLIGVSDVTRYSQSCTCSMLFISVPY